MSTPQHPTGDDASNWFDDPNYWYRPEEAPERPKRIANGVYGNGRLANQRDLETLLNEPEGDDRALTFPETTVLVEDPQDSTKLQPLIHRNLHLPAELREKHVLAIGQTGVGKTQKLILPQLACDIADPNRTVIALDAKGGVLYEFMQNLAKRHRPHQKVLQINLKRPERCTTAWNPVIGMKTRSEALEIAHAVCTNVDSGIPPKDPFWVNSSIALLADVLYALAQDPKENQSLVRAKALIDGFPNDMAVFADAHPKGYPAIYRVLENAHQNPNTSIIADLAMRLMLFGDEGVAACTSGKNELSIPDLISNGGMLVLEVFESDAAEVVPLTNLFITRLFSTLMHEANRCADRRLPRPTSLTLDELGSACGKIPDFEKRLATLRSRGVSLIGAVQTLSQLHHLYEMGASAIIGNFNTKLFFGGGLGLADSKFASDLSGTMTAESVTIIETEHGEMTSVTRSRTPVARPVLLPEEVARPPVHPLLGTPLTVFTPSLPPFFAYLKHAFELWQINWALQPYRTQNPPTMGR